MNNQEKGTKFSPTIDQLNSLIDKEIKRQSHPDQESSLELLVYYWAAQVINKAGGAGMTYTMQNTDICAYMPVSLEQKRLYDAAPDMLEACKAAAEFIEGIEFNDTLTEAEEELLSQLKAAIKAARGV